MRFSQLDRIIAFEKGQSITGVKCLSLSEEYLQDHFPRYAVMPGVLMMESIFQAASFLSRLTDDFRYSMVVMSEARNFKFQGFVRPGDQLVVEAKNYQAEGDRIKVKVRGEICGNVAVTGQMTLTRYNLVDRQQGSPATDAHISNQFRQKIELLLQQSPQPQNF